MSLTTAQKRALHHCPGCGHLLASHDTAGCAPCVIEGGSCAVDCAVDTSSAMIETTYAAVERLLAMDTAVPPGPCWHDSGVVWPGQSASHRCELLAGHAGAHTCSRPGGGESVWTDDTPPTAAADLQARIDAVLELHRPWFEVDGRRHDAWVHLGDDVPEDHECRIRHLSYPRCEPQSGEHVALACPTCSTVATEDQPSRSEIWPCPTVRAVTG